MAGEIGLIDVGEWQAWVDMENGRQLDNPRGGGKLFADILARHPYPGDLSPDGNAWVADLALEAVHVFEPSLIVLHFANHSFRAIFGGLSDDELSRALGEMKVQIDRFLEGVPDYDHLVVGLGGYTSLKGYIDLMHLEGLAFGGGMGGHICGLYRPSERDLEMLREEPRLVRLVSREEFRETFGGCNAFYQRFPDYLVEMEKGWVVKTSLITPRNPERMGRTDGSIPVYTEFCQPRDLVDLRPMVEQAVAEGKKVALILGEGWSLEDFPYPCHPCASRSGWFEYDLKSKLTAIFSGRPVMESYYPPISLMYKEEDTYPFSVHFNEPSSNLLGRSVKGLSVAVGNRSIIPHALFGADVTFECYARYLYNYGSMAILQGQGLEACDRNLTQED